MLSLSVMTFEAAFSPGRPLSLSGCRDIYTTPQDGGQAFALLGGQCRGLVDDPADVLF